MKKFGLILVVLMALLLGACAPQNSFEYNGERYYVDWEQKQVSDENHTYSFGVSSQSGKKVITVTYPDGQKVKRYYHSDYAWTDAGTDPSIEGYATVNALNSVIREAEAANQSVTGRNVNLGAIFGGLLLVVVGLISAAVPEMAWKIKEGWKYDGGVEPSSFLLKVYTTCGVISVVAGIAIIIGGLFGGS